MDQNVSRILSFWFDHPEPVQRWFTPSVDLDNEIRDQFGDLVNQARSPALDNWIQEPDSTLALLLLLDQFPRNIFRGSPESYSSDPKSLNVTIQAIAKGFDRRVPLIRQPFFYLPLMHDETLLSQIAGKALYENCAQRCGGDLEAKKSVESGREYGEKHMDVIMRFNRFPSRNKVLGRKSTDDELEFLKEHPNGF